MNILFFPPGIAKSVAKNTGKQVVLGRKAELPGVANAEGEELPAVGQLPAVGHVPASDLPARPPRRERQPFPQGEVVEGMEIAEEGRENRL